MASTTTTSTPSTGCEPGCPASKRCIEAQVMDWADDVAYSVHDLEDGVEAGLIKLDHLSDVAGWHDVSTMAAEQYLADADEAELEQGVRDLIALPWWPTSHDGSLNSLAALKNLTSQLIGRFCQSAEAATREAYGRGPLTRYDADLVVPRPARVECALLKAVTAHYVMNRDGVEVIRSRQRTVLLELVEQLWNHGGEASRALVPRGVGGRCRRRRSPARGHRPGGLAHRHVGGDLASTRHADDDQRAPRADPARVRAAGRSCTHCGFRCLRPGQPWSSVDHDYDYWPDTFHVAAFTLARASRRLCDLLPRTAAAAPPPTHHTWRLRAMATARRCAARAIGAATLRYGIAEIRRRGGTAPVVQCPNGCRRLLPKARIFHGRRRIRDRADRPALRDGARTHADRRRPALHRFHHTPARRQPGRRRARRDRPRRRQHAGDRRRGRLLRDRVSHDRRWRRATSTFGTSRRPSKCRSAGTPPSRPRWRSASAYGEGQFVLHAKPGQIEVEVTHDDERSARDAHQRRAQDRRARAPTISTQLLTALRWSRDDLDPAFPPMVSYGGAWHPVLAANTRERLADLDYDFERMRDLMTDKGWTTIQLIWRESPTVFHARDPFAVGGVVEDPATGAAAAALGPLPARNRPDHAAGRRSPCTRASTWAGPVC